MHAEQTLKNKHFSYHLIFAKLLNKKPTLGIRNFQYFANFLDVSDLMEKCYRGVAFAVAFLRFAVALLQAKNLKNLKPNIFR